MKKLMWVVLTSLSIASFANERIESSIYDIDYASSDDKYHLVLLTGGEVLKAEKGNSMLEGLISNKSNKKNKYSFRIDKNRYIKEFSLLDSDTDTEQTYSASTLSETYVPTTVASMDVLKKYFKEAPYNPKESQCFNRAMGWSYGWWKNHSLRSMKMFIFFTRNYIRKYNFEWWFHVTPYAHVMENGKVVERMLDVKYSSRPLATKDWSDIFMRNKASCNVITKYSDYADYPYTGDCYYYRANMYYYQPADLQMNEAWGYTKDNFNMTEVRAAFKEAFEIDM